MLTAAKNRTQGSTKGRTLVISDIHGAARALSQVLDRAYVTELDTIIQIGDVADGYGETSECVDILIKLSKTCKCIFLRGNHDIFVFDWITKGWTPHYWTSQGGKATLESYVRTDKLVDREHIDFWKNQLDWYIDETNRLYIHAGWEYRLGAFPESALRYVNAGSIARECHWDRSLLEGAASASHGGKDNDRPFKATKDFKEVYVGHTATANHLPIQLCNVINTDSGCGWGGKLTIIDVDTKEFWQSDFSKDLYPEEKGR